MRILSLSACFVLLMSGSLGCATQDDPRELEVRGEAPPEVSFDGLPPRSGHQPRKGLRHPRARPEPLQQGRDPRGRRRLREKLAEAAPPRHGQ